MNRMKLVMVACLGLCVFSIEASTSGRRTASGIELDSPWKVQAYDFAQKNLAHPSWGVTHGERNYHVTLQIAKREGVTIDEEVLFAAALFHDMGGLKPYEIKDVDHAVRSVELLEPLLRQWGFPMAKWPLVSEMVLGHTYYGEIPVSPEAKAFRDADVLDFLGEIGIARILAITLEGPNPGSSLAPFIKILRDFDQNMAANCQTATCREFAVPRQESLHRFLKNIDVQSRGETAL